MIYQSWFHLLGDEDVFEFPHWPIESDDALDQYEDMIEEDQWTIRPIPVWNSAGDLILPRQYEKELKGAMVAVDVTLSYTESTNAGDYQFFADVDRMEVLRSPLPIKISSTKRALPMEVRRANKRVRGCSTEEPDS